MNQSTFITAQWLDRFIDHYLTEEQEDVEYFVEKLKTNNADLTDIELARKLKNQMARRSGFYGAATGMGEMISMPLTVPVSLLTSWKLQIRMIVSIAYIFGYKPDVQELKRDIYLLLARQALNATSRGISLYVAKMLFAAQIRRSLTKAQVKLEEKLKNQGHNDKNKAPKTKVPEFSKIAAFAGVPVGFLYDYISTRQVGKMAIKHFRAKNQ